MISCYLIEATRARQVDNGRDAWRFAVNAKSRAGALAQVARELDKLRDFDGIERSTVWHFAEYAERFEILEMYAADYLATAKRDADRHNAHAFTDRAGVAPRNRSKAESEREFWRMHSVRTAFEVATETGTPLISESEARDVLIDFAESSLWARVREISADRVAFNDTESDDPDKVFEITTAAIQRAAYRLISENLARSDILASVATRDFDAESADCLAQLAAFGEIIYG